MVVLIVTVSFIVIGVAISFLFRATLNAFTLAPRPYEPGKIEFTDRIAYLEEKERLAEKDHYK
jgi:hypothetical protein